MEVYFWSLIVAVSIFGIGGGMSIYEGITHIQHPAPLENPTINYIVLALAASSRRISFSVAWRVFRESKGERARSRRHPPRQGPEPVHRALRGHGGAARPRGRASSASSSATSWSARRSTALASVVIGCILVVAALWLAYESQSLLVGEAADPEMVARHPRASPWPTRP